MPRVNSTSETNKTNFSEIMFMSVWVLHMRNFSNDRGSHYKAKKKLPQLKNKNKENLRKSCMFITKQGHTE